MTTHTATVHAPTVHTTTKPATTSEHTPVATVHLPRPALLPKERYACTRATD